MPVMNEASSEQRNATAAAISPGSARRGIGTSSAGRRRSSVAGHVRLVGDGARVRPEVGGDEAGADAVRPDPVVHVLDGDGSGELEYAALGRVVRRALAGGDERGDGPDRDDRSATGLEQMRDGVLQGEERARQVHPHHRLPRVQRGGVGDTGKGESGARRPRCRGHRGRPRPRSWPPPSPSRRRRRRWPRRPCHPPPTMASATATAAPTRTSTTPTVAPSAASRAATARPIPLPPPVTIARRPSSRFKAFPGHAGRCWPLLAWRLVARTRGQRRAGSRRSPATKAAAPPDQATMPRERRSAIAPSSRPWARSTSSVSAPNVGALPSTGASPSNWTGAATSATLPSPSCSTRWT